MIDSFASMDCGPAWILPMGLPRQAYWSGLPFPSLRKLSYPVIELTSPALAGGFFTTEPPGKPKHAVSCMLFCNCSLLGWGSCHSAPNVLRLFILSGCQITSNAFFFINWYRHMTFLLACLYGGLHWLIFEYWISLEYMG